MKGKPKRAIERLGHKVDMFWFRYFKCYRNPKVGDIFVMIGRIPLQHFVGKTGDVFVVTEVSKEDGVQFNNNAGGFGLINKDYFKKLKTK